MALGFVNVRFERNRGVSLQVPSLQEPMKEERQIMSRVYGVRFVPDCCVAMIQNHNSPRCSIRPIFGDFLVGARS